MVLPGLARVRRAWGRVLVLVRRLRAAADRRLGPLQLRRVPLAGQHEQEDARGRRGSQSRGARGAAGIQAHLPQTARGRLGGGDPDVLASDFHDHRLLDLLHPSRGRHRKKTKQINKHIQQ